MEGAREEEGGGSGEDKTTKEGTGEGEAGAGQQEQIIIAADAAEGEDGTYYVVVEDENSAGNEYGSMQLVQVEGEGGQQHIVLTEEELAQLTAGGGAVLATASGSAAGTNASNAVSTIQVSGARSTQPAILGGGIKKKIRSSTQEAFIAETEDGSYEMIQLLDDPLAVGATATAEAGGGEEVIHMIEPIPQGMKMRRNRVFGTCRCPECGQTFVNTARLERHLAVHQVFGSYLCPLCGKTYKYEYNLFYHWRRTCRDLNELMNIDDRKAMDVNALRQLVDEVAAKKAELGTLEPPFRHPPQMQDPPPQRAEIPQGRRGEACPECGVVVLASHLERHMAIHRGEVPVDTRGVSGGFYCDLCGLMFRQHFNLIKHWRTNCPEIQLHLNPDMDLTMDDETLKHLVEDLLQKKRTEDGINIQAGPPPEGPPSLSKQTDDSNQEAAGPSRILTKELKESSSAGEETVEGDVEEGRPQLQRVDAEEPEPIVTRPRLAKRKEDGGTGGREEADQEVDVTTIEEREAARRQIAAEGAANQQAAADEAPEEGHWVEGFADDAYGEEEQMGRLPPVDESEMMGPLGFPTPTGGRAKWSMAGGPVQCPECFRSFANAGRLERHLAGFHASYGTHHCSLCGNRFKYDYNLLYHYRRSCPYTKAFIDRDVREQMDAPSLRKLVRNLAQKEVRLTPHVEPPPRLAGRDPPRPRLAMRYPSNQPPAHLLMPRPGLPEGKTCPVCGIIFYGVGAIQRHMQAAHPAEWEEWAAAGGEEGGMVIANYTEEEELERMELEAQGVEKGDEEVAGEMEEGARDEEGPPTLDKVDAGAEADIAFPDPTLETSIATFLTEMRQEASGQQEGPSGGRPLRRSPRKSAETTEPAVQKKVVVQSVEGSREQEPDMPASVLSANFEEDLDVVDPGETSSARTKPVPVSSRPRTRTASKSAASVVSSALRQVVPDHKPAPAQKRRAAPEKEKPTSSRSPIKKVQSEPTCEICTKTFLSPAHLMQHRKRVHGVVAVPVTCPLCQLEFREKYSLVTHWRSSCGVLKTTIKDKSLLKGLDEAGLEQLVTEIANGAEVVEESELPPGALLAAAPAPSPVKEPPRKRTRTSLRKAMVDEDVD